MSCYKCDWLGLMGPCPHEGELFPITRRTDRHRPVHRILDVVTHIELGVMDDDIEELEGLEDLDAEELRLEGPPARE